MSESGMYAATAWVPRGAARSQPKPKETSEQDVIAAEEAALAVRTLVVTAAALLVAAVVCAVAGLARC